jgi:Fur family transcriptional regulator, ferric uptake regulator
MEKQKSNLEQRCLDKGLRMTDQRRTILTILSEAADHPDVEQVYQRAFKLDPRISIATVYRTLRLLEEMNLLESHDFREGKLRYEEASSQHHDHLINMKTGDIVEFQDEAIEALQKEVALRLGYRLIDHRLELYGVPLEKPQDKPLKEG